MLQTLPDILARIVETKRRELEETQQVAELENKAADSIRSRRDFAVALRSSAPAIIAECKKGSPSKGIFQSQYSPVDIASKYEQGGAAAISVLTDRNYFYGDLDDLRQVRAAVSAPVLRKDFTLDERHVVEAAAYGADAILLIAAILDTATMRRLREMASRFEMASLVEVHDEDELASAIDSGATIIGVNNRDLHLFTVDIKTSLRLGEKIPAGTIRVSESGIRTASDIALLRGAGYDAFLVGEHLMQSENPVEALRELRGAR